MLLFLYPAVRPWQDESTVEGATRAMSSGAWVAAHLFAMVGFTLVVLGLVAVWSAVSRTRAERLALAAVATGVSVREPGVLLVAVALALALFSSLGVVVGIYAETFDHHTFVNNIVILPLTFLGGVFYSVSSLASPWEELSHVNPVFYLVNAVRYGFLGTSDVSVVLCFAVTAGLAIPAYLWSQWLFTSGRKLKA